jgi:hypothetical protein
MLRINSATYETPQVEKEICFAKLHVYVYAPGLPPCNGPYENVKAH